jgi:hypothetical protein
MWRDGSGKKGKGTSRVAARQRENEKEGRVTEVNRKV